ncbi:GntR family transcriptional regulator [Ancylobacter sp. IITR112]|uniref:GntR family transcriptional regulator n=1 Tax=Ancylobacter sp. IITR112 TaxID=3138073 RepID=UPI00352A8CBB
MTSKSRTAETYERIKKDILDGRYLPNERLAIDRLSEGGKVSPGAVREALSRLTSDGLVVAEAQRGFFAAPVSAVDLRDLTEVRVEIEVRCLASAMEHRTLRWEADLIAAHHQLAMTPKSVGAGRDLRMNEAWSDLHAQFHAALVATCANSWWLKLRGQLFLQAERYRRLLAGTPSVGARDVDFEHERIMQAAIGHDTGVACSLLAEHLRKTASALLASRPPESTNLRWEPLTM